MYIDIDPWWFLALFGLNFMNLGLLSIALFRQKTQSSKQEKSK